MAMVRRRKHQEKPGRITTAAVEALKTEDRLTLHRELRLPPWQVSPLDAVGDCPWLAGTAGRASWMDSVSLREMLHGHG